MKEPFEVGTENSKIRRKLSQRQEKRWAGKVDGKPQPASGALWGAKGDVKVRKPTLDFRYLWENKYTSHKSFSISIDLWMDIYDKAVRREGGYTPGIQLEITHESLKEPLRLVIIDENDFLALKEQAEANTKEVT